MIMIGIDPHKSTHTAVAIDSNEFVLAEYKVRASPKQVQRLQEWASDFDDRQWAVESAGGLGYLLAQQLVAGGEVVFDVPPMLASRVRLLGTGRSQKNDPNDARSVAIAALRSERLTTVSPENHVQVLRMLAKRHRDMSRTRAKAKTRLHALMLELRAGGLDSKMSVNKAEAFLETVKVGDAVVRHRMLIAQELVAEIAELDARLKSSNKRMAVAVSASGTTVTNVVGIGPFCAATIIGYTGDIGRFATKSHYATYNATAPIEASSGDHARHRLNPRGNRHLNHVIHIAAVSQLGYPSEGRAYYDRKRAEGKSGKEAIRCLKRKISDAVYRHLVKDMATQTQASQDRRTIERLAAASGS